MKPTVLQSLPLLAIIACTFGLSPRAQAGSFSIVVAGFSSDNIVKFDLSTGQREIVARLGINDSPRGIAVDPSGVIHVSLRGGAQNVVRLVPHPNDDHQLVAEDLTPSIGNFGPGLISFHRSGDLFVAGDASRVVFRYDANTGKQIDSFTLTGCCNMVGLTLENDSIYVAEYFQRRILRFDVSASPVTGATFVPATNNLNRPLGMTIGHNGNLMVANDAGRRIQEFEIGTGNYLGEFIDLSTVGVSIAREIHYAPRLNSYFVSSGDAVYQFDTQGTLMQTLASPALRGAYGIAVVANSPLIGDLTNNGFVDFEDLTILLANWNRHTSPARGNLVNADTTPINFEDLTVLLADWTGPGPAPAGSPEAALGTEAVPEPSGLLLAVMALLGLSFYRRRRRRTA